MPPNRRQFTPRFRRVKELRAKAQSRDLLILNHIHKHRFLTSEHIAALVPGGPQGIRRRLYKLFHGGYLDRPREQIRPFRRGGDHYVYGLGRKGYELLRRTNDIPSTRCDWTGKNREVKQRYIGHTLLIAHFMVCLELACRRNPHLALIEPSEILARPPAGMSSAAGTCAWSINAAFKTRTGSRNIRLSLAPDRIFGLLFSGRPPARSKVICFLEADRATMPVKRAGLYASSYRKKLICYWESWRQNLYEKHFGCRAVRVITLTKSSEAVNSRERIGHMIAACQEEDRQGRGSKMFLFAQADDFSLAEPQTVLGRIWQNGLDSEFVSLLD
jgi:hypothetical protein